MNIAAGARILVTGATGFIGRALVAALVAHGYQVTASGRNARALASLQTADHITADLTDPAQSATLRAWRWDAVVHLAGAAPKVVPDWDLGAGLIVAHVRSTINLCAAVPPDWTGRFVYASGFIVYGIPEQLPVTETHPRRPLHAYALAKVLAEDVILLDTRSVRDRWVLRLPGIFSERRRNGTVFRFTEAARRGTDLIVDATRPLPWDLLHLDDAVRAMLLALTASTCDPGAVNVGYGEVIDFALVAERLARRAGAGARVRTAGSAVHPRFVMDTSRMESLIGPLPHTLDERLDAMLAAIAPGE